MSVEPIMSRVISDSRFQSTWGADFDTTIKAYRCTYSVSRCADAMRKYHVCMAAVRRSVKETISTSLKFEVLILPTKHENTSAAGV